jgi:hypothetical protein
MSTVEILVYTLGTIAFFFALAFAYYAFKNARLMRGPLGHRLMAFGATSYIATLIIGAVDAFFFPGSGLVFGSTAAFLGGFLLIVAGGISRGKEVKRVHGGTIFKVLVIFPHARLYLIAISTLLFIGVPIYLLDLFPLFVPGFTWFSVGFVGILAFAFVILAVAEREFHLAVRPSAAAAAAARPEELLLREDIRALRAYSSLTNGLLARMASAIGASGVREVLARCAEDHPILLGDHEPTKNGMLDVEALMKSLDRIHEAERVQELFSAFSNVNTKLIDLYAAVTSPDRAAEAAAVAAAESERFREDLWRAGMPMGKYNEVIYEHEILLGLPEGVAEEGKARTFARSLFKRVLEPLLKECKQPTIRKVQAALGEMKQVGVEVSDSGEIALDGLYGRLSGLKLEDGMQEVMRAFSTAIESCYPAVKEDLGVERTYTATSEAFSDLLAKHGSFLQRYDIMGAIPEGVEIPGTYRPLDPGKCYLVEGWDPEHAFGMFGDMVRYGFPGLCISTSHPMDVEKEHELAGRATVLWLSKTGRDYAVSPSNLGILRDRISAFVSDNENAVVLLDGIEYLTTTNGFDLTLKFIHDVREAVVVNRARLIVPIVPRTLEPRQLELLERYMEVIEVVEEEKERR